MISGGHIKPDCYKSFNEQKAAFGIEEARKLNSFELANLKEFVRFIKDNNLADEVDLVETRAVDVFLDNSTWAEALSSYESLQATGAHVDHIKAFNSEEVESVSLSCYCHVEYLLRPSGIQLSSRTRCYLISCL